MSLGRKFLDEAYYAIYQNDFQKAIILFKKAIDCEPSNALYYHKLSITYSRNDQIIEALQAAQKACELSNNQIYYYHLQIIQAKNYIKQASNKIDDRIYSEEVERLLILAKNLDPLNIEAYLLLGIYYGEKGIYSNALKEINLALKLDPSNQHAKQLKQNYIILYKEGG